MKLKLCFLLILTGILMVYLPGNSRVTHPIPRVIAYFIDVGFYPDHQTDFAGFIEILWGKRPSWNKEDSIMNYPYMAGKAIMTVDLGTASESGGTLNFYIHSELRTHWVKIDSQNVSFTEKAVFYPNNYSQIATRISFPSGGRTGKHQIEIRYGGVFNPSVSRSPSDYMRIDNQGAYLRGFGYSLWFPVIEASDDEPMAMDFERVRIKSPEKYSAVFTGKRISESVKGGFRTSVWQSKNTKLWDTQVTVRPYKQREENGVFLYYMNHPGSERASEKIIKFVRLLLRNYSENYRPIRHGSRLYIAELPNYASGISSGNMIGLTSGQWRRFSLTEKTHNTLLLIAHELVHHFVQTEISMKSPMAALIIEGFPSYFHLHSLSRILGEAWYTGYMKRVETAYLKRKRTKTGGRGRSLPKEKPILSITFNEIGAYKDTFILNDRVRLFLNWLRHQMGMKSFKMFTRRLCGSSNLTPESFKSLILRFLPGKRKDLTIWLETNEYPARFRLHGQAAPK